jgi:hypothetical protein
MQAVIESSSPLAQHSPSCTCPEHPLPAALRVREARDIYLAENGFTADSYTSPTAEGALFRMKFSVPNPPAHQRAIRFHDLHHVATGYGTDHAGEAELSAWQARRGLLQAGLYVTSIVLANIFVGLGAAPARTIAALRGAQGARSLFSMEVDYDRLLDSTVGELRVSLGIPAGGLAIGTRRLHAHAPGRDP